MPLTTAFTFWPTNRNEPLRRITAWPAGVSAADNLFFFEIEDPDNPGTYFKHIRTKTGPVNILEAAIVADGITNQTTLLNTVLANTWLKELEFYVDGGGEVLVTGTVTVPEDKILIIRAGTKIKTTGAGVVNGGIIDADPYQEIFTGTRNVNPAGSTKNYLSANWYGVGAPGYTPTTNADNANLATQLIINSNTLPRTLYFPDVSYSFDKPIELYKWDSVNSVYTQHTGVEISGNTDGAMQGFGTTFYFTTPLAFGIGIHIGKGCIIRRLRIIGTFAPSWANMKAFVETKQADYGAGSGCLDGRYATNAGIVIDYLRGDVPPDGGYTTILSQYRGSTTSNSGSTKCEILNCTITNWVTGVAFSINGQTQNCDSMVVADSCVQACKWTFSFGQDQTRNCWIRNILCWDSTFCFVTNSIHGNQSGAPPSIDNVSLAGQINQFAHVITGGRTGFGATKVFCESIYRIGLIAGEPSSIRDFEFDFMLVAGVHPGIAAPDLYATLSKVTMADGRCRNYDNLFNKRMNMAATRCIFNNVRFDLPPIFQMTDQNNGNRLIDCTYGTSLGDQIGAKSTIINYPNQMANAVQHGKFTVEDKGADVNRNLRYTTEYDFSDDYEEKGGLGSKVVTVDAATRTATFPSTDFLTTGQIGEYIITDTAVSSFDDPAYVLPVVVIGRVTGYAANVVTLSEVPTNIITGTYTLYVTFYKTVGNAFTGDTIAGNPVITNVEFAPAGVPVVGTRLAGGGGAYNVGVYTKYSIITAVDTTAKTVTINLGALITRKDVVFSSAKRVVIYSTYKPDDAAINYITYPVFEGTEFIVQGQAFTDGRNQTQKYRIIKGGHLNQGVVSALRQAEWSLNIPLRVNAGNLERMDLATGLWSTVDPIDIVVTATDANSTMADITTLEILPTATGNRILTLPTASALTGRTRRIWNKNSSLTFSWTLTPVITLPDDSTTSVIPNDSIITLQSNGSVWVQTDISTYNTKVVTATDANATMAATTEMEILPAVTVARTLTLPSAITYPGKVLEIWNKNTHATLNWSFAAAITLPDNTTSTLIPKNYITRLRSDGAVWVNVDPALFSDSTLGGSGSEADPIYVRKAGRPFATTASLPSAGIGDGDSAYDEQVDKFKIVTSGVWTSQT